MCPMSPRMPRRGVSALIFALLAGACHPPAAPPRHPPPEVEAAHPEARRAKDAPPGAPPDAAPAPPPVRRSSAPMSYEDVIAAIAADIAALKGTYPQLAAFSVDEHCYRDRLIISYEYRTAWPQRTRGGWAGSVPHPDEQGVWFYIDLHDPDSTRQIHTQPVVEDLRYRDKKVMLLILEGRDTAPLGPALRRILLQRGVRAGGWS